MGGTKTCPRAGGFTLIEVLAVVFMTAVLLGVALNFYVDLSKASVRATELTRGARKATSLLDRLARDFEAARLVKTKEGEDPIGNPWIFVAESRLSEVGADHVKFVQRTYGGATDVAMVAYMLRQSEDDDTYELLRWSSPRLPESAERDFPSDEDPATYLVADGIESFGIRLIGEDGEARNEWDSMLVVESGELPRAVEFEVTLRNDDAPDAEPLVFTRRAILPVAPLDLEALVADPNECQSGTLEECVDIEALIAANPDIANPALFSVAAKSCFDDLRPQIMASFATFVNPDCQ